jgi:hypothetical protein
MASESNDATLGADQESFFVSFDGLHTHGGEDLVLAVLGAIFLGGDDGISILLFESVRFFLV